MLLTIAICEDENIQRQALHSMIDVWGAKKECCVDVSSFCNANQLSSRLTSLRGFYDLFFLDVGLSGSVNGYELGQQIRLWHKAANLAFITTDSRGYLHARTLRALEYLIKPVRQNDLDEVLEKAWLLKSLAPEGGLRVKNAGDEGIFPYSSILYLSSMGHDIRINDDPRLSFRGSLEECHKKLGSSFSRIHSSWLVHLGYVTQVESTFVLMWDGKVCSIGGTYRNSFLSASAAYAMQRTVLKL